MYVDTNKYKMYSHIPLYICENMLQLFILDNKAIDWISHNGGLSKSIRDPNISSIRCDLSQIAL